MSERGIQRRPGRGARRWEPLFDDVIKQIFALYPEAEKFDPCPCGITLAIVSSEDLAKFKAGQTAYFAIPDEALREEVRSLLITSHRTESHKGDLLVLAERA